MGYKKTSEWLKAAPLKYIQITIVHESRWMEKREFAKGRFHFPWIDKARKLKKEHSLHSHSIPPRILQQHLFIVKEVENIQIFF